MGGVTAEPTLGLCSSKLPSARREKWEAFAFCAGLPAHVGQCLKDVDGWDKQPTVAGACAGLSTLAGMGPAPVCRQPPLSAG